MVFRGYLFSECPYKIQSNLKPLPGRLLAPLVHKQLLVGLLVRGSEVGNDLCHSSAPLQKLGLVEIFSEPGCSLKQFFPIYLFSALLSQVSYPHCGLKFLSSDSCSLSFYFSQMLPPKSLTHLTPCWQLLLGGPKMTHLSYQKFK